MDPIDETGDTPPAEVEASSTGDEQAAKGAVTEATFEQQVEQEMLGAPPPAVKQEPVKPADDENDRKDGKDAEPDEKPAEEVDPELELARKGKLTPEVFQKRIGKEVGKRKGAEEAAAAAKAEAESAKAEAAKLRAELEDKTLPQRANAAGLHPTLLLDSEDKVEEREERIAQFKRWAAVNAEGYEGQDGEGKPVTWTKEQIAEMVADMDYELTRIAPKARKLIAERQAQDQFAQAAYPRLFEAESAESKIRAGFLKRHPTLRLEPNCNLIVGDMIAGEQARRAAKKAPAAVAQRKAPPSPVVPSKGGRTEVMPVKAGRSINLAEVDENPRSLQDFMEAVSEKSTK